MDAEQNKLGRIVNHDARSLAFGFDTTGLTIVNKKHERHIGPLDQNPLSSCTGNAGIGNLATTPIFEKLPENFPFTLDEPGAIKLYSEATKIDEFDGVYPPNDNGSSGLAIAKVLYNAGLISGYQHTFTLEDALKAGSLYPFITGIPWYSGMFHPDPDGRVRISGNIVGGHEIEMDEIDADNGKIWFTNSWSTSWGINGRFYLTWADFKTLLDLRGDVIVMFPRVIVPPAPVPLPTLRAGDKGLFVKTLQTNLNKNGATLVVDGDFGLKTLAALKAFQAFNWLTSDGICGKNTWQAFDMIDIITKTCNENGVEPLLGTAVSAAESNLNPKATLFNPPSNSTDRGLFQWNNKYHPEITDAMAFDPVTACKLFCIAVKQGNLHAYWSASQPRWIKRLTPELKAKYHVA